MTIDEMLLLNESNLPTVSNILDRRVVRSSAGEGIGDFVADLPGNAKNILITIYEAILQVIWLIGRNLRLFLSKLFSMNGVIKLLYKRVRETSNDLRKNLSLINASTLIANSTFDLPEYKWDMIHKTATSGFIKLPIVPNEIPYTIRIGIEKALEGANGSGRMEEDGRNRFVQTIGAILVLLRDSIGSFKSVSAQINKTANKFPNLDLMPFEEIKSSLKTVIENGSLVDDFADVRFELIESVDLRTHVGADIATALIQELDKIEKTDLDVDNIGRYFNKINFDLKKIESSFNLGIKELKSGTSDTSSTEPTDTHSEGNVETMLMVKDTVTYLNNILLTLQTNKTKLILDMAKSADDIINQSNYILSLVNNKV